MLADALSKRGHCSARHFNCAAHALTHRFVPHLLNGSMDEHFSTPSYQRLLSTFKNYHDLPDNFGWEHIKLLLNHFTDPYDREILFGDVFRQLFGEINEHNPEYKQSRKEHFQYILTSQILHSLEPADKEFLRKSHGVRAFSLEFKKLFKILAGKTKPIDFLNQYNPETNTGFYDIPEVKAKISEFWENEGFKAWIDYIKSPFIFIPIDVLMNGAAALEFDVTAIIQGGISWSNIVTHGNDIVLQRPFSLSIFNLKGAHYEVALDSVEEAITHNQLFKKSNLMDEKCLNLISWCCQHTNLYLDGIADMTIQPVPSYLPALQAAELADANKKSSGQHPKSSDRVLRKRKAENDEPDETQKRYKR